MIDKPSGLSVHPGWDRSDTHVMGELKAQLGRWVWPVHRLDRATSGVLALGLDTDAARALSEAFAAHAVDKRYVALARGVLPDALVVDHPVRKDEDGDARVDAVTELSRIATVRERYSLMRAHPLTGRLHQIRRHFRHLRAPILGDTTYGDNKENKKLREEVGLHRLALHAVSLTVPHPDDARPITARAPLPPDLREPLARLGFDESALDAV